MTSDFARKDRNKRRYIKRNGYGAWWDLCEKRYQKRLSEIGVFVAGQEVCRVSKSKFPATMWARVRHGDYISFESSLGVPDGNYKVEGDVYRNFIFLNPIGPNQHEYSRWVDDGGAYVGPAA